jgi:Ribbon-helix-helix domain
MKKGDLSKFIEEAVRRRVLQCTIQDIRARNADAEPDEIQRIVDEAVSEVRAAKPPRVRGVTISQAPDLARPDSRPTG